MNICLATVHLSRDFTPLALLYLKAFLVAQRTAAADAVRILEFGPEDTPESIARRVLESGPAIVGLSCYVWNIKTLRAAVRRLRELKPDLYIVLGGPEVGPVARTVLEQNPAVDCVVKSEGEFAFDRIVQTLRRGGEIATVKGICFRREGRVFETEDAEILRDLNDLASPLQLLEGDTKRRIVCIETQRGCVFRCNFCFEGKDLSIRNRRFDLERVKAEFLFWLQRDISWIYLMDPVFNLNAARAKEICRFVAAHNQTSIPIHAEVWAEFIDEEMAELMRAANFRYLEVGLQTTDTAVLATVERRLKLAPFLAGVEHLKRADIPFQVQLIYGLPGETRATFRESLNFAASLQAPELGASSLMVLPGTELRKKAAALNIEFDSEPPYLVRSHYSMTSADLAYGARLVDAINGVGNAWTIRLLARERGTNYADLMDAWLEWRAGQAPVPAPGDAPRLDAEVRRFILHYCSERDIPADFYAVSAALEFGAGAAGGTGAALPA